MNANEKLLQLRRGRQSPWLDHMRRSFVSGGDLERYVREAALGGITTHPLNFREAIADGAGYADLLARHVVKDGPNLPDLFAAYQDIVVTDAKAAAIILRKIYEGMHGCDGFVSVHPTLHNLETDMVEDAVRIYDAIAEPNVMITIPASQAGIAAVRKVVALGIPVNVTLIFSQQQYIQVAEAYISGLEDLLNAGHSLTDMASVASVFISGIDQQVDKRLGELINDGNALSSDLSRALNQLKGKAAIANAKLIYEDFQHMFSGPRWQALVDEGAHVQRLCWTSTDSTNPEHSPTHYVDSLIGPDTVNAMSLATWNFFRKQGTIRQTLTENVEEARYTVTALESIAVISLEEIARDLLGEGLRSFDHALDDVIEVLASFLTR